MPPWLSVSIQVVLTVLAVVATAVVNTKIKFAPTKEAATQELKQLAFRICRWLLIIMQVGSLVFIVSLTEKVTHLTVLAIASGVASLMYQTIMFFVTQIKREIYDYLIDAYRSIRTVHESILGINEDIRSTNENIRGVKQLSELYMEKHKLEEHTGNTPSD
jgi:hypothetical protein